MIRSFPMSVPSARNHVVDDADRFYNADYSYRGLASYGDDVIHLDWDQAVSRRDLARFANACRQEPDTVRVVPVEVDPDSRAGLTDTVWNCRVYTDGGAGMRYCAPGDPVAHLFGFGMVYLPGKVLAEFEAEFPADSGVRFDDTGFAGWYTRRTGGAALAWDVHCVHLHYRISEVVT